MAGGLVDSAIIVDILRSYEPALEWFSTQPVLAVSRPTVLEILQGVRDKAHQQRAVALLDHFDIVPLTDADAIWATGRLLDFQLSHNVGALDALIAGVAYRLQVPFYTRNLKHFAPMLGALVKVPY